MLLFIGVVFSLFAMMTSEAEQKYDMDIDTSMWEGKYDYAQSINETVDPIVTSVNTIGDEEAGWFEKVGAGFTGIIAAVKLLPTMLGKTFLIGGRLITGLSSSLGVPSWLSLTILISLTIWGIFKLIGFLQRWEI